MSDEQARQAFIDTILAEPQAESHRLIFADWLEENDDLPRAEGLRTLPGLAGVWSSDWGNDKYGLWCAFRIKRVTQKMRWIPSGKFLMGSPEDEEGRYPDEGPRHRVTLTEGFWLADTPCTQSLWKAVLGENPSEFPGSRHPVENVDFSTVQAFLEKVNERIPGLSLGLPTEAQWEYACRAGTESARYHDDVEAIAWIVGNSDGTTHPVKQKLPNAWGLCDMLGSVWEWCRDGMREYRKRERVNPVHKAKDDEDHCIRGSSWDDTIEQARAAYRAEYHDNPFSTLGFRCAAPVIPETKS